MTRARNPRDPIFALIEKHALTIKAFYKANLSLSRLQARLDARPTEKRRHESRRLTCRTPFFDVGGSRFDPAAVIRSREQIRQHVLSVFDRIVRELGTKAAARMLKHEKAAVAELQAQYDRFQRAHRARRNAVMLTVREKSAEDAELACMNALLALTKARATTPEGQTALVKNMAGLSPGQATWWALHQTLENLCVQGLRACHDE